MNENLKIQRKLHEENFLVHPDTISFMEYGGK
jgi:hypothetical protein